MNTEKLLEIIKKLCSEQGFTLETNKFFASELGISERTISRMIKSLKEDNQISMKRVDNKRQIIICIDKKIDCMDNNSVRLTEEQIQQDIDNLSVIPVWQIDTITEYLIGIENDLSTVLITRLIRIFGFKVVLQELENYLETTENVIEQYFRSYMDKKYTKYADAKEIRRITQVEFS